MTEPLTPARLAELDALFAAMTPGDWVDDDGYRVRAPHSPYLDDGNVILETKHFAASTGRDTAGIVALHNDYPALSAALRAAWAERDNAMNTAKIATERAVYWMKYGETNDARLAEAEELLRPFADYANAVKPGWPDSTTTCLLFTQPDGSLDHKPTVDLGMCRAAAAFLASEAAK